MALKKFSSNQNVKPSAATTAAVSPSLSSSSSSSTSSQSPCKSSSMSSCSSSTMAASSAVCPACGSNLATSPVLVSLDGLTGRQWHAHCLRCVSCGRDLSTGRSCYFKNGLVYCREDYTKTYGGGGNGGLGRTEPTAVRKCSKCFRTISPQDWVRRAAANVYHLACFACDLCQRQFSTGEKFIIDMEEKLLCKLHFDPPSPPPPDDPESDLDGDGDGETLLGEDGTRLTDLDGNHSDGNSNQSSSMGGGGGHHGGAHGKGSMKTKRVRTTFTEEQIAILQANFQMDSNPDGQDLERIATLTGLSKRVTQVWFQNSRARQKKYMNKGGGGGLCSGGGNCSGNMVGMVGSGGGGGGGLCSMASMGGGIPPRGGGMNGLLVPMLGSQSAATPSSWTSSSSGVGNGHGDGLASSPPPSLGHTDCGGGGGWGSLLLSSVTAHSEHSPSHSPATITT